MEAKQASKPVGRLALTRNEGQIVCIGDDTYVQLIAARHGQARLLVVAPRDVSVMRGEIAQ